jgi:hypothetical protein
LARDQNKAVRVLFPYCRPTSITSETTKGPHRFQALCGLRLISHCWVACQVRALNALFGGCSGRHVRDRVGRRAKHWSRAWEVAVHRLEASLYNYCE